MYMGIIKEDMAIITINKYRIHTEFSIDIKFIKILFLTNF